MNIVKLKEKLFPEKLRLVDILIYVFTVGLLVMLGIPKRLDVPTIWRIALFGSLLLLLAVGALVGFRSPQRILGRQRMIFRVSHSLVAVVLTGSVLSSVLEGTWKHGVKIFVTFLFLYVFFFFLARFLFWLGGRGLRKTEQLMRNRRETSEKLLITGVESLIILGYMRPGRRALFIVGGLVMGAAMLYGAVSLGMNKMYLEAIVLVVGFFLGNFLVESVFHAEVLQRRSVEGELQAAHNLQMSLMPKSDPRVDGFDISALCNPAEEVGGDYYDYVWLDEAHTQLGIALADVSGKAMKAAMTAVMTSGMVYREVEGGSTPKEILSRINKPMYLKTERNSFTAMLFAVLDIEKKTVTLSNAGQTHPLLLRDGRTTELRPSGTHLPLGVMDNIQYQQEMAQLRSRDVLLFYTDGVTESMNSNNEMFGFERLEQRIRQLTNETSKEAVQAIVGEANNFAGKAKQHDDMTVVVVRVV